MDANFTATSGIGFGTALAMVISYDRWHSVGWAILHGIFSWFYVVYFLVTRHKPVRVTA